MSSVWCGWDAGRVVSGHGTRSARVSEVVNGGGNWVLTCEM